MPVTGLDHYNLRASRPVLDALRDFYVEVVGLQLGRRPPFRNHGYWLYAGPQAVLHLTEAAPGEVRPGHVANTLDHVAFSCTDLPEAVARLKRHRVAYASGSVPLSGQRQLFFEDPAGNGVELNFVPDEAG